MTIDLTFRALSDPTRRVVVERLAQGPCRASELAEHCGVTRPALNRHLRLLEAAELIESRPDPTDGRARKLLLRRDPFEDLDSWLERIETCWTHQLASFAAHVEGS